MVRKRRPTSHGQKNKPSLLYAEKILSKDWSFTLATKPWNNQKQASEKIGIHEEKRGSEKEVFLGRRECTQGKSVRMGVSSGEREGGKGNAGFAFLFYHRRGKACGGTGNARTGAPTPAEGKR